MSDAGGSNWSPKTPMIWSGTGFVVLVMLAWTTELFDLPHWLLGAPPLGPGVRVEEALLETLVIATVAVASITASFRASRRIAYLESLTVVCAWCGHIRSEGSWVSCDVFLRDRGSVASHGICPTCERRVAAPGQDQPVEAG